MCARLCERERWSGRVFGAAEEDKMHNIAVAIITISLLTVNLFIVVQMFLRCSGRLHHSPIVDRVACANLRLWEQAPTCEL